MINQQSYNKLLILSWEGTEMCFVFVLFTKFDELG